METPVQDEGSSQLWLGCYALRQMTPQFAKPSSGTGVFNSA